MRKLDLGTPSEELVNGYLSEIAKAYGVKWSPPGSTEVDDEVKTGTFPFSISQAN